MEVDTTKAGGAEAGAGGSSGGAAESGDSFMSQMTATEAAESQAESGEGGGSTLMGQLAGDSGRDEGGQSKGDEPGQGDKPGQGDPALGLVPEGPDGYGLTFGEETEVDQDLLGDFTKTAHELGLNKGQAQKLAAMYEGRMAQAAQKVQAEQAALLMKAKEAWVSEIKGRPTYQAEVAHVKRALARFGSPELNDLMNESHLGDHPVFWDFMSRAGAAMAEPGFHGKSDDGGKEPPLIDRMWKDR